MLAAPSGKAFSNIASNSLAAAETELVRWEVSPVEGLTLVWAWFDWLTTEVSVVERHTVVVAVVQWLTVVVAGLRGSGVCCWSEPAESWLPDHTRPRSGESGGLWGSGPSQKAV